ANQLAALNSTWNNIQFALGSANQNDVVSAAGQTITLPTGQSTALALLATAVGGNQTDQSFTVTYQDGTTQTLKQSFSDWAHPQSYANETTVLSMSHRNKSDGSADNFVYYLYGYSLPLNATKPVKSITLPNNSNIEILAITEYQFVPYYNAPAQ